MDRGSFSNSRRARHFGRSNQNSQSSSSGHQNHRGNLRETYLSESHSADFYGTPRSFLGSPVPFMSSPLSLRARDSPVSLMPPYFDDSNSSNVSLQLAGLHLDENNNSRKKRTASSSGGRSETNSTQTRRLLSLPAWALDENRDIKSDLTLEKVLDEGLILAFAMDKAGCHFLQSNYYGENTQEIDAEIRNRMNREVLGNKGVFLTICKNSFGNFFMQRVIEHSTPAEQEAIKKYIVSDISALCLDKSACRVVQTALEILEPRFGDAIVASIPPKNCLMAICTDRNANHVMQKIIKKFAPKKWEFLVTYLVKYEQENLLYICRDKYGCRVVQTIVEVLSEETPNQAEAEEKSRVLRRLMTKILAKCTSLTHNEFANYIIQHIIESPGILDNYRNTIIEQCLLRNLLSMSQEKYASHVIERAFVYAPLSLMAEMMDEIFDGYVPHPDTGKDALDILIFHQFGNYVVQRMLQTCVDAVTGQRNIACCSETRLDGVNYAKKFENWLNKLYVRIRKEKSRLTRFSSGKKMLDILSSMEDTYQFMPPYDDSSPSTRQSSRRSSISSESPHFEFDVNNSNYHVF
ncbi:hypothetical protein L3Y34_017135 [Caenorhabditis briggsae]|uniref:PUM-HD domain-containing protein n=1 Tax=Caenorhabditis briggsae TaxID=6238 RepID=A0AAE9DGV1_CAEBR|nr:hypothetical protein L3Y34_017135 [Caenorhabditis briggsae]